MTTLQKHAWALLAIAALLLISGFAQMALDNYDASCMLSFASIVASMTSNAIFDYINRQHENDEP